MVANLNDITTKDIHNALVALSNPEIAAHSTRFFKTGKGEYGEGDKFLGIRVPVLRAEVKRYQNASLEQVGELLQSAYHEERLFALLLLVRQFERGDEQQKLAIYTLYLNQTAYINNWDLVDCSAHKIVGAYLRERDKAILYQLAESRSLWERRIAMMSTYTFIKHHQFDDALKLARSLLQDEQDLIHKIVGWMLREIGKRERVVAKNFLTTKRCLRDVAATTSEVNCEYPNRNRICYCAFQSSIHSSYQYYYG